MGKSAPPPTIVYSPPPPPPPPPTPVPTQSLQTQTALNEVSGAQARLNMTLGAQLDQQNKEFFTTQDIRQSQATGAETRATIGAQGEQERATQAQAIGGQLQTIGATGEQTRQTVATQGEQERLTAATTGEQQRLTATTQAQQQRRTLLQQQMQDNYVAQRNRDWSQQSYRVAGQAMGSGSTAQPPGLVE